MEIRKKTDSDQRGGRRGITGTDGEGSSQGTYIKDLWTWTTGWGLTAGVGE